MVSSELEPKSEDIRLACAFIPDVERRAGVLALFALLETVREIPERVTEALMGEIRLRWWYEAFEAIGQGRTPHYHPLTELFQRLIPLYGLPVETFLALIEAQMPLLDKGALTLRQAMDVVCGEEAVYQLARMILDAEAEPSSGLQCARMFGFFQLQRSGRLTAGEFGDTELAHLLADMRVDVRGLSTAMAPLALPAVAGLGHRRGYGPLRLRLSLLWTYLTGRV
ncbi:squalene [Asticcacaulis biprosthecium C19]|uniref:Squalene n=1 Tax=Asticcacaulis biprosthecium C19 TaxID=715226 RepID=F4QQ35_9CAUL|nr:squalene/phytoene synthase family protein [Asticcacaulis biprosthecium]EGF90322.1 squalene [Asticcacaulis biprosthecium C19]